MMRSPGSSATVLACEDLGDDLPRPPLAAVRFFRASGFKMSLRAWDELPVDVRWAIAKEGARDRVDQHMARTLMRHIPMKHVELVGDTRLPEVNALPGVIEALRVPEAWLCTTWPHLPAFHRFILNVLRNNRRLMWRAYAEIQGLSVGPRDGWIGTVAHAEVEIRAADPVRTELLSLLATEKLLDGRGLILARASGLRAARAASELFDLYSGHVTGSAELDWSVDHRSGTVLWQAHVSTYSGGFFSVASMAAASTAAICLADMLKEFDPRVRVRDTRLAEEEWAVGRFDGDAATALFSGTQRIVG